MVLVQVNVTSAGASGNRAQSEESRDWSKVEGTHVQPIKGSGENDGGRKAVGDIVWVAAAGDGEAMLADEALLIILPAGSLTCALCGQCSDTELVC